MHKNVFRPVEILGQNFNGDFVFLKCSKIGFLASLKISEYLTSEGKFFIGGYYWDGSNMIANNGSAELLFQSNEIVHLAAVFTILGDAEVEIFRNVTFSNPGTLRLPLNKNFTSPFMTPSIVSDSPSVSNYGTAIMRGLIAAGEKKDASGGEAGNPEDGFIIPDGENILLRLTNLSSNASRAQIKLLFTTP